MVGVLRCYMNMFWNWVDRLKLRTRRPQTLTRHPHTARETSEWLGTLPALEEVCSR